MAPTGPRQSGPGHSDCCLVADASSVNAALSQSVVQSREAEKEKKKSYNKNILVQDYRNTDVL